MLITIVQIVARPGTRNVLAFLRTQTLEQRRARSGADTILGADRHEPGDGLPMAGDDERLPRTNPSQQLRELAVGVGGRDGGGHGGFLYVVLLTTSHYLPGLAASLPSYIWAQRRATTGTSRGPAPQRRSSRATRRMPPATSASRWTRAADLRPRHPAR